MKITKAIALASLLFFFSACGGGGGGDTSTPSTDNGSTNGGSSANPSLIVRADIESGRTGTHLLGLHFVYSDEKDAIYDDDATAKWAKQAGIKTARYPGGNVINYWDWKDPSGYQKVEDRWGDPTHPRAPVTEWMDLDEYLHFVDISGIKPLIGVNILSGVRFNMVDQSVIRAAEQVQYVMSRGHPGAFYYLGNEDMNDLGGLEEAARIFALHAAEIKRVDPSAKLFWNDNAVTPQRLRQFLAIVGDYADGVEFHGKWPYGDESIVTPVTVADWQSQYPIEVEKRGRFSERAIELKKVAAELGYPDLMVANNEYGLAQFAPDRFVDFNRFHYGLVAIELLQDLFVGQFDMAAFWSNVASKESKEGGREDKRLINTQHGNRLNPVHRGFELLASAQGKKLARIDGGSASGSGFAVIGHSQIEMFLLNKTNAAKTLTSEIRGLSIPDQTGMASSLEDTPDHWGQVTQKTISVKNNRVELTLPAMSFTKIVLQTETAQADEGGRPS